MKKILLSFAILIFALTSCNSPAINQPVEPTTLPATATIEPTESPTAIPTATASPTKTSTPTIEPTPTELPLQIETDFTGSYEEILARVENMTPVKLEDFESGKYTKNEQRLLSEGKIAPFSEEAIPLSENSLVHITMEGMGFTYINIKDFASFLVEYDDVNKRPFKLADMAMTEIETKKELVMSVMYLNNDRSVGFIHYLLLNYNSQYAKNMISSLLNRESSDIMFLAPVISIEPEVGFPIMDPDKNNRNVLDLFVKYQGPETDKDAEKWIETGNVPIDFQNKLLLLMTIKK